jgi:hypothetical protein
VHSLAGERQLLVLHSHDHRDHILGDAVFAGDPNTEVIGAKLQLLSAFLGVRDWPNEPGVVDLGDRPLTVIPTPGHQEEALTVSTLRPVGFLSRTPSIPVLSTSRTGPATVSALLVCPLLQKHRWSARASKQGTRRDGGVLPGGGLVPA